MLFPQDFEVASVNPDQLLHWSWPPDKIILLKSKHNSSSPSKTIINQATVKQPSKTIIKSTQHIKPYRDFWPELKFSFPLNPRGMTPLMYCVEPAFSVPSTAYVTLICAMTLVPKRRAVLVGCTTELGFAGLFFLKKTHHDLPGLKHIKTTKQQQHLYWTGLPVPRGAVPIQTIQTIQTGTFKEGNPKEPQFLDSFCWALPW